MAYMMNTKNKRTLSSIYCHVKKRGSVCFTLIEMLVVISIIAILAALLMPSLQSGLAAAKTTDCANTQKQIYLAISVFAGDHDDIMPLVKFNASVTSAYSTVLFPPVDQLSSNTLGFSYPSPRNALWPYLKGSGSFSCPVDPRTPVYDNYWGWWQPKSTYLFVSDRFSICYRNNWGSDSSSIVRRMANIDRPSSKLMLMESDHNSAVGPNDCGKGYSWGYRKFSYLHNMETGFNAMYSDGHIQFIPNNHVTVFTLDYKNNYFTVPGYFSSVNW